VLEAFTRSPLDRVEINLDIKWPGRESEVVEAVRAHGLIARAMVSGLDLTGIDRVRALGSELRLGWTIPQVQRSRDRIWTYRPFLDVALWRLRRQIPGVVRRELRDRGVYAVWAHHALVSRALVESVREHGVHLIAWTVDDPKRISALQALGVAGICTNDPRLLNDPANVPGYPL
jgi:glycerophosphoryl diester phosphodiesterase